jgi:mRNA-degrading endonuclease YafQ of YafQ-DinJ toxin-antitoxin module
MKFQRTPQFAADYRSGIDNVDRDNWDLAFPDIIKALQGNSKLHHHFRMKKMEGWPGRNGIWEGHIKQNLCFTFHFDTLENGERSCFFRRLGTHNIYKKP